MIYDTASFRAFLSSLGLENVPVTTRAGQMIPGPPPPVFEAALRLGLGRFIVDTPASRQLLAHLGISPGLARVVGGRLRSRADWRRIWAELAEPHLRAVDGAIARGETAEAIDEIRAALALLNLAYSGDGYYIHTPLQATTEALARAGRLYRLLWELSGERVERVRLAYPDGETQGLLHFPTSPAQRYPTLLALHPAGGDKDSFDFMLFHFRAAGFATLCLDLPAHGENLEGPRLRPDAEAAGVAALEMLAARPEVDTGRLAVMGGSLGAFFAQRTAAASPLAQACLAYASPFDIGRGFPQSVWGIRDLMSCAIGAPNYASACEMLKPFHLRDTIGNIRCPLALIHGTQDHICDFTATFDIARRARCPLAIFPIVGADHEVAQPGTDRLARPGIAWLRQVLGVEDPVV